MNNEPLVLDLDTLTVTLLALIPKDGTPCSVRALAAATNAADWRVTNALSQPWRSGEFGLQYDDATDSYFIKRG